MSIFKIIIIITLIIIISILFYLFYQFNNIKNLIINKSIDINNINNKLNSDSTIKKLIVDDLIINNKLTSPYIDTQTIHCNKYTDKNRNKALNITSPVIFKQTIAITDKDINLYDNYNKKPELFTENAIIKHNLAVNNIKSNNIDTNKMYSKKLITKYDDENTINQ